MRIVKSKCVGDIGIWHNASDVSFGPPWIGMYPNPNMNPIILALALACGSMTTQATPRTRVIVAIGDSMTAGYGVAADSSYPAQLERELKNRGYQYRVVNQG